MTVNQPTAYSAIGAVLAVFGAALSLSPAVAADAKPCAETDTGIVLPKGFCATVFADKIGHARQMAVAGDGTVFVNTWSGVYYNNDTPARGRLPRRPEGHQGRGQGRSRRALRPDVCRRRQRRHRHLYLQGLGLRRAE